MRPKRAPRTSAVPGAFAFSAGMTAKATTALFEAGINMLGLQKLTRSTDLQLFVAEEDYDDTVRVLHKALVEDDTASRGGDSSEIRTAA